jgi:hypothetical protein
MTDSIAEKKFLTQGELADRFRVSNTTIKNWRAKGLLEYFQAPGSSRVLYPANAVDEFERQYIKIEKGVVRKRVFKRERSNISASPKREWRI